MDLDFPYRHLFRRNRNQGIYSAFWCNFQKESFVSYHTIFHHYSGIAKCNTCNIASPKHHNPAVRNQLSQFLIFLDSAPGHLQNTCPVLFHFLTSFLVSSAYRSTVYLESPFGAYHTFWLLPLFFLSFTHLHFISSGLI